MKEFKNKILIFDENQFYKIMNYKVIFLFIIGWFMLSCKNQNTIQEEKIPQTEETNTFEIINKSFEEKLNEFIDVCEGLNERRGNDKIYNITVGLITETADNYENRISGKPFKTEVTFMFFVPTSCDNIIGMKKVRGYTIFYASLGEDIDRQIIKINKPFSDCLKYAEINEEPSTFDPFEIHYIFKNKELLYIN